MRATRRGGATGVLWSVVIGGVLAAWLHSSQIALPSDLAEVQPEPALDPAPRAEPAGEGLLSGRPPASAPRLGAAARPAARGRSGLRGRGRARGHVPGRHQLRRPGRLGLRARRLLRVGAVRPRLRPLPERRAAGGTADRRRRARRDPARHADHVGRRARARRDADRHAAAGPDGALLGGHDRAAADGPGDREGRAQPPLRRARADADRRRGPGRLGDRAETGPPPRIRSRSDRLPGRRTAVRPAARGRRRPAAARRHLAHRARARGLRGRARDLRVLAAAGPRADRALPALHGARRAGRHRPAAVRGDRLADAGARRRGPPARRAARAAPVALVAPAQAQPRPDALGRAAGRLRAAARLLGAADQARVARPRALLAGADGRRRQALPDRQVPDDVRGRRGAEGRARAPEQAHRGRADDVQDPGRPADHAVRPASCGAGRSTSCRSSGTCCAAR